MGDCDQRAIRRLRRCPWRSRVRAPFLAKASGHGPYLNKIDIDRCAKGPLESGNEFEAGSIGAFIDVINKGDLALVVSGQPPNLVITEMGGCGL